MDCRGLRALNDPINTAFMAARNLHLPLEESPVAGSDVFTAPPDPYLQVWAPVPDDERMSKCFVSADTLNFLIMCEVDVDPDRSINNIDIMTLPD